MPKEVVDKANTARADRGPGTLRQGRRLVVAGDARLHRRAEAARDDRRSDAGDLRDDADDGRRHAGAGLCIRTWASSRRCSTARSRQAAIRWRMALRATITARAMPRWSSWCASLHEAGVPIVAGTDGWGIEVVRELELYQQAGFTPAEALQTRDHRPGPHGRRRQAHRLHRGRQGGRSDAGRRRRFEGPRRASPRRDGRQRRLRHGRRRAARRPRATRAGRSDRVEYPDCPGSMRSVRAGASARRGFP